MSATESCANFPAGRTDIEPQTATTVLYEQRSGLYLSEYPRSQPTIDVVVVGKPTALRASAQLTANSMQTGDGGWR
jgi:hypothetical protein